MLKEWQFCVGLRNLACLLINETWWVTNNYFSELIISFFPLSYACNYIKKRLMVLQGL